MNKNLVVDYIEVNTTESGANLFQDFKISAYGYKNEEESGEGHIDLKDKIRNKNIILIFYHYNYVGLAFCKWHYQTPEQIMALQNDPEIAGANEYPGLMGKTMIFHPNMDLITFWHTDYNTKACYLLNIVENVFRDMGLPIITGAPAIHETTDKILRSGNDIQINDRKFCTIGNWVTYASRTEVETYEFFMMNYVYDDALFRKCLPDKEYYLPLVGGWCDAPEDETEIDPRLIPRVTGLKTEFPDFEIDNYRKRLIIKSYEMMECESIEIAETLTNLFSKEEMKTYNISVINNE